MAFASETSDIPSWRIFPLFKYVKDAPEGQCLRIPAKNQITNPVNFEWIEERMNGDIEMLFRQGVNLNEVNISNQLQTQH